MTRRRDILARSRQIRRRKNAFKALLGLLALSVMFALVVWFFHFDFFLIKRVDVKGADNIEENNLAGEALLELSGAYLGLFPKENIFIIPKDDLAAKLLDKFPRAGKIKIGRNMPSGLEIEIEERKDTALVCKGSVCAFADENGFVFEKASVDEESNFLKLYDERGTSIFSSSVASPSVGKNVLEEKEFKKILEFKEITDSGEFTIKQVSIKEDGSYLLETSEGWNIILNSQNDVAAAFANLALSLNEEIKGKRTELDYVDLRFGNKVFYKFKE